MATGKSSDEAASIAIYVHGISQTQEAEPLKLD